MANARQVRQQLDAALADGVTVLVADLTATRFCDSMGCRALVLAHQRATAGTAELRLVIPSPAILRVWPSRTWIRCCGSTRAWMPR